MELEAIKLNEIPIEILECVGGIKNLQFPRQGHTFDVGIIETENGMYVLKRTKGKQFCSWLSKEVLVLNCLLKTNLPIPLLYKFIGQKSENQSWTLKYIEGETLRNYLFYETNQNKRHFVIHNYGKILSDIHSTVCPGELINRELWLDEMLVQTELNLKNYNVDGSIELLIDNVLVKDGEIKGVIDWSGGDYEDPRYDVSLVIRPKPRTFENKVEDSKMLQ